MTNQEVRNLAGKIVGIDKYGGFTNKEFNDIFAGRNRGKVFEMPVSEVIFLVNEYKEKHSIKIGDVVVYDQDIRAVVLDKGISNGEIECVVFNENGCVEWIDQNRLTKVWNSDLVNNLLKNIRGD